MHVVVRGVGLGGVFVSCAAYALCASRGHSDSHAREPLHACDTCRHLQGCHSRVELTHLRMDSWLVKERLCRGEVK